MKWLVPTVTASTMIAQVMGCAQVQMSQWACGNLFSSGHAGAVGQWKFAFDKFECRFMRA
jgi:hypothetical protein